MIIVGKMLTFVIIIMVIIVADIRKFISNIARSAKKVTLPLWMFPRKNAKYEPLTGKKDGVVVTLTTFQARIGLLWILMDSLFRQTVRPDKIVLVLTEEEFPDKQVPKSLSRLQEYGLEIVFLPYNLKCHNKYFYALQTYKDATVVTVDDDCYYKKDMIARLLKLSEKYPQAVCCNIAAIIDKDNFYHYKSWKKSSDEHTPSDLNVALGFAGILYPKGFGPEGLFDQEAILKNSPISDDLWLKTNEINAGIKVACGSFYPKPVTISGSQKISLRKINKGSESWNDIQWKALDTLFNLKERI